MCNHCTNLDPRDEILYGATALRAICDLVSDVGEAKQQFTLTGPKELAELLGMVSERISAAADKLVDYAPRNAA